MVPYTTHIISHPLPLIIYLYSIAILSIAIRIDFLPSSSVVVVRWYTLFRFPSFSLFQFVPFNLYIANFHYLYCIDIRYISMPLSVRFGDIFQSLYLYCGRIQSLYLYCSRILNLFLSMTYSIWYSIGISIFNISKIVVPVIISTLNPNIISVCILQVESLRYYHLILSLYVIWFHG